MMTMSNIGDLFSVVPVAFGALFVSGWFIALAVKSKRTAAYEIRD